MPERATVVSRSEKSAGVVVCAGQRVVQEGSSPSGARMRSVISERGGNASRAGERRKAGSSQSGYEGERREICSGDSQPFFSNSSEGRVSTARWDPRHEEKYRVVVEGAIR